MFCGNRFCIYNSRNLCLISNHTFDDGGRCLKCVWLDIDESLLVQLRAEQRRMIEMEKTMNKQFFRKKECSLSELMKISDKIAAEIKKDPSVFITKDSKKEKEEDPE